MVDDVFRELFGDIFKGEAPRTDVMLAQAAGEKFLRDAGLIPGSSLYSSCLSSWMVGWFESQFRGGLKSGGVGG